MSRRAVREALETELVVAEPPVVKWISTGCTQLDLAITNGLPAGFPVGRTVEISGPPSSSKTVLGMLAIGYCQRMGGIGFFCDVEDTFQNDWSQLYGIDVNNSDTFRLTGGMDCPETVEQFYDEYLASILKLKDSRPKIVVVDSLAALSSQSEKDTELSKATFGMAKAKQMSASFRKYNPTVLSKANVSLIYINQIRDNVGVMFGPKYTTGSGWAVPFYSSVRVSLTLGPKMLNSSKKVIGVWINFKVDKNKVGIPFREGSYRIIFNYGLDDIASNLSFLKDCQVDNENDPVEMDEDGKKKKSNKIIFNGETGLLSKMVDYVETNGLEDKLKEEVAKVWKEVYTIESRKPRTW